MKRQAKKKIRKVNHRVSPEKERTVKDLKEEFSHVRTILLASCRAIPGQQFQEIKKSLRGKADVKIAKKTLAGRAIEALNKEQLRPLKNELGDNTAIMLSDLDPYELAAILIDNQTATKAKAGDVSPEDIQIDPGPTELLPGPAISELSGVGLKVAVKEGKLEIIKGAVVVKKGDKITSQVASVLGKLGVRPMKVGFIPLAAYDSKEDKVFLNIEIDKEGALDALQEAITKSLGFAVKIGYPARETITFFIAKAAAEEKAILKFLQGGNKEVLNTDAKEPTKEEA